jgi:hypothetical protein
VTETLRVGELDRDRLASFGDKLARQIREEERAPTPGLIRANGEARAAKESERERQAKTREQNGLLWIDYYMDLAESLALRSAEYQRRAHALGAALAGRDGRDDA